VRGDGSSCSLFTTYKQGRATLLRYCCVYHLGHSGRMVLKRNSTCSTRWRWSFGGMPTGFCVATPLPVAWCVLAALQPVAGGSVYSPATIGGGLEA